MAIIGLFVTPDTGIQKTVLLMVSDHDANSVIEALRPLPALVMPGEIAQLLGSAFSRLDSLKTITAKDAAEMLRPSHDPARADAETPENQASIETVGDPRPNDNSKTLQEPEPDGGMSTPYLSPPAPGETAMPSTDGPANQGEAP